MVQEILVEMAIVGDPQSAIETSNWRNPLYYLEQSIHKHLKLDWDMHQCCLHLMHFKKSSHETESNSENVLVNPFTTENNIDVDQE